jgi:hypothetical protein
VAASAHAPVPQARLSAIVLDVIHDAYRQADRYGFAGARALDFFYLCERIRRWASASLASQTGQVCAPFLSPGYIRAVFAHPAPATDKPFHRHIVARHAPEWASVPHADELERRRQPLRRRRGHPPSGGARSVTRSTTRASTGRRSDERSSRRRSPSADGGPRCSTPTWPRTTGGRRRTSSPSSICSRGRSSADHRRAHDPGESSRTQPRHAPQQPRPTLGGEQATRHPVSTLPGKDVRKRVVLRRSRANSSPGPQDGTAGASGAARPRSPTRRGARGARRNAPRRACRASAPPRSPRARCPRLRGGGRRRGH